MQRNGMRRFARPLCAIFALFTALAHAEAASLAGERFDITSSQRGLSTYLGSASPDVSGRPIPNPLDETSVQAIDPLTPATGRFGHFIRPGFDGAAPDSSLGNVTTITVEAASSAVKLTNPDVLFNPSFPVATMVDPTGDFARLAGSGTQPTDQTVDAPEARPNRVESAVGVESSIPLPPALPLLAAAILALAVFGYGLNRWVAPRGAK